MLHAKLYHKTKKILIGENGETTAVQIPIEEFQIIEELLENYGLAKLMDEVENEERLSLEEARAYYQSLKQKGTKRWGQTN